MKNILVVLSSEKELSKIKDMIKSYLGDKVDSLLIDYTANCDDAFEKISVSKTKKNKYDTFIFNVQGCGYYTGLLDRTESFKESIRFSIDKFSSLDNELSVKADYKRLRHVLVNDAKISQFNDEAKKIFKLIFETPSFYFSYGNEKFDDGIGHDARTILEEIQASVSKIFPFINIKKDYSDFKKGDLLEPNIKELVSSTYIFMVMNKRFIHSPHCMKELYEITTRMNYDVEMFNRHTFLITSEASEEYLESHNRHCRFNELRQYWIDDLKGKMDDYVKNGCRDGKSANDIINIIKIMEKSLPFIRERISHIIRKPFAEIKDGGYFSLLEEVNTKLVDNGYPNFYPEGHEDNIINALRDLTKYQGMVSI